MIEAVESVRAYFEDHIFPAAGPTSKSTEATFRNIFDTIVMPAVRRWDLLERDRLAVPEIVPDLPGAVP